MKPWVLVMLMLSGPNGKPVEPAMTQFDSLSACGHRLYEWISEALASQPGSSLQSAPVKFANDSQHQYLMVVVGKYTAMCIPSDQVEGEPWTRNSP